ncbi:hypothetical protein VTJ04DRAFT_5890 [Mycothermus thermophilus]|uniref:uncharacterized protein n=1 Tax=Humicola insolens TaxID=85995 RepID=UPI0037439588
MMVLVHQVERYIAKYQSVSREATSTFSSGTQTTNIFSLFSTPTSPHHPLACLPPSFCLCQFPSHTSTPSDFLRLPTKSHPLVIMSRFCVKCKRRDKKRV